MNIEREIIEHVEKIRGAQFVGVNYIAKNTGEIARYTLRMGVDYVRACEKDIEELELAAKDATGIQRIVIGKMIDSLQESIFARMENREHRDYTKPYQYRSICPGVKINLNDLTLEIQGFEHARLVIAPGEYKPRKSSLDVIVKKEIEKQLNLRRCKFKTLCLEREHILSARICGETIN